MIDRSSTGARPAIEATVIPVGSELLGDRPDTNGPEVARRLVRRGFRVAGLHVVPDDVSEVRRAIAAAVERGGLTVVIGGLGPTDDDLTREAVSAATALDLVADPATVARLDARARGRGEPGASVAALRMALVPAGAAIVDNAVGTAPGSLVALRHGVLLLLPGPPGELLPMLDAALDAAITRLRAAGRELPPAAAHGVLRLAGIGESAAAERIAGAPELAQGVAISWLARPGDVELHLRTVERCRLDAALAAARHVLGQHVISDDGRSLPEVIVPVLAERLETVTAAESCTGGLVAAALTSVPGSSKVLRRAFVTYADEAKVALGVDRAILEARGAVSAETVEALALAARRAAEADWSIAISGIAGPDGGTADKPVGLVHVGLAHPDGVVESERHVFMGDRDGVRRRSVQAALFLLKRRLG